MATDPPNSRTGSGGARFYWWPGDTPPLDYVSVTTAIDVLAKPALAGWAARSVAEYAWENWTYLEELRATDPDGAFELLRGSPWRKRDAAAKRGTAVHTMAEETALGLPVQPVPEHAQKHADGYKRFLDEWQPRIEMSEAVVYNREHRYAGQLDMLAFLDHPELGFTLADIKTGKAVYEEVGLQCVGYEHAEFIGMPDGSEVPMPKVDACAVIHMTDDGLYHVVKIRTNDRAFSFFIDCVRLRWWRDNMAARAIGKPLRAPTREADHAAP